MSAKDSYRERLQHRSVVGDTQPDSHELRVFLANEDVQKALAAVLRKADNMRESLIAYDPIKEPTAILRNQGITLGLRSAVDVLLSLTFTEE